MTFDKTEIHLPCNHSQTNKLNNHDMKILIAKQNIDIVSAALNVSADTIEKNKTVTETSNTRTLFVTLSQFNKIVAYVESKGINRYAFMNW